MAIEKFSLEALSRIDEGRLREGFDQALRRCLDDCRDRPALGDARTVQLSMTMTPVIGEDGNLESADVRFQVHDAQPKRRSKVFNMKHTASGLLFNELSPADIRQGTLDQVAGPQGVTRAG